MSLKKVENHIKNQKVKSALKKSHLKPRKSHQKDEKKIHFKNPENHA